MAKLTKTFIDRIKPPEKGQRIFYDDELKGFGVRVTKGAKSYIAQGRVKGKVRRVKIGTHGPWTLDQARKKAHNLLVDMANGIDPNLEKKVQVVQAKTLEEVQNDYLRDRDLKPSSVKDYTKHLNGIFKEWKNQPITVIDREGVMSLFRKASKNSKAQTNQAFRLLRALFNYAIEAYRPAGKPIIIENPVNVLSGAKMWHNVKERSRRIPTDKIGKAWNYLDEMRNDLVVTHAARSMIDAVTFCILTGARWGEVQKLTWENVNLENETWHISDPKNRNSITLPLSSQALKLLEDRPRIKDNSYVFSSNKSKTGYIGPGRFVTDKISEKIGMPISAHDLRRTFRAIAGECQIELYKTKLLMNHKLNQDITISAYTETSDLRYLKDDIQKIGNWIERQGKLATSEKVVDLEQARKVI